MSILRLILYFGPFLKEVFKNSSEEKRVWIGRFLIVLSMSLIVFYLMFSHVTHQNDHLTEENVGLKMEIGRIDREKMFLQEKADFLTQEVARSRTRIDELKFQRDALREELDDLKKNKEEHQHKLSQQETKEEPSSENDQTPYHIPDLKDENP